jgi:NADH-quinone oxidoreductase subunit C
LADAPTDTDATEGATEGATADAVESGPAFTERQQSIIDCLQEQLGDGLVAYALAIDELVVRVQRGSWRRAAEVAKTVLGCDYLSFISVIDWMPTPVIAEEGSGDTSAPVQPREMTFGVAGSDGRFQVFAHVASTRPSFGFTLKTDCDEADPAVDSWVPVYPGADWHEREAWEMFGVRFDGHPSLRHLYLPTEFEGHPGRKDFPLLSREVKPWPGLVDVEAMPGEPGGEEGGGESA